MKRCSVCKQWLQDDAFGPDKRASNGLRCDCRSCRSDVERTAIAQRAQQPLPLSKRCSDCGEDLPSDAFNRDAKIVDGLHGRCKRCRNVRRRANRSTEREYERRYRATHPEQVKATGRRHYWRYRDRKVADMKLRYQANKAARQATNRAWYERNRERAKESARRWVRAHRSERRVIAQRGSQVRRARLRGVEATLTAVQWQTIVESYRGCCAYCGQHPRRLTMDHVKPLAKGGAHTAENVVPACEHCNYSKHVSPPPPFQPLLLL